MRSFVITSAVFFGMCLIYILIMLSTTGNYFTYILDDAYIHLAIAKNVAEHGIWGITEYGFSSSSSSPVFTGILSLLIFIFGDHSLIPLIFNLTAAALLIYCLNRYYARFFRQNAAVISACLFSLFFALVHVQIVSGMEHVLHILVIAINICFGQKWLSSGMKDRKSCYGFYATLVFLGLIRFETMFYFVSLAFVFLVIKKFKEAAFVLIAGFVPILIFGYFNYGSSGYFFPNSLVVKGTLIDFSGDIAAQIIDITLKKIILNVSFYKIGFFPLLIGVLLIFKAYRKGLGFQKLIVNNFLVIVWSLALLLHCLFSEIKGVFRYEAYLLMAFSMVLIPRLEPFLAEPFKACKREKALGVLVGINLLLMIYKLGYAHVLVSVSSASIYSQQIQSARFLRTYYNTSRVVANDIGAICYFTHIHLLDFMGLGSNEMVYFKTKNKKPGLEFEHYLTRYSTEHKYQLAIAYEEWLDGHTPKNWKKVARLRVKGKNFVLGEDHLFIYSIDPGIRQDLKEKIRNFKWSPNVEVTIIE